MDGDLAGRIHPHAMRTERIFCPAAAGINHPTTGARGFVCMAVRRAQQQPAFLSTSHKPCKLGESVSQPSALKGITTQVPKVMQQTVPSVRYPNVDLLSVLGWACVGGSSDCSAGWRVCVSVVCLGYKIGYRRTIDDRQGCISAI
jgi:hypothetical protein